MTAAAIAPTSTPPSDIEDRRNQHRDKANVLLRLVEAVEDSNQRRRKASHVASKATSKDLALLSHDLQSQAAKLKGSPPPSTVVTPDNVQALQTTVVNVVTAVYQLREHAHLQYQMLEMKYFDLKRHAFDVENQNRKLQLQLIHRTHSNHPTHPHTLQDTTVEAQHDELMAQLQQENDDLRQQLRESCAESRKLVQENYGLRKILMDNGVGPSTSPTSVISEESKDEEEDDTEHDFQDAQEFDAIPEEEEEEVEKETTKGADAKKEERPTKEQSVDTVKKKLFMETKEQETRNDVAAPTQKETTATSDNTQPQRMQLANASFESALETDGITTIPLSPAHDTTIPISRSMSIASTSTNHSLDTFGTAGEASTLYQDLVKRKRNSRKSVTFAAMANKLAQANHHGSASITSFGSSTYRHDDNDSVSTFNTTNTEDVVRRETHDRNMALSGGRFAATPEPQRSYSSNTSTASSRHNNRGNSAARELMRQQKTGKQALTAKELMRKQGGSKSSSKRDTFQILMSSVAPPRSSPKLKASKPVDPIEEEQRLSALLGGFRSGNNSSRTNMSYVDDNHSVVSSASTNKKSIFRRRKSQRNNDDDSSVASSKSLGFLFQRRPSNSVKG